MKLNEWIHKYVADDKMQDELNKWDLEIAENKGYEQGVIEGIEQGIEQGVEQNKNEIAKKLLNMNMSIEDISKATNLSIEEIEKLKKNNEINSTRK